MEFFRTRADILVLQETHSTKEIEKSWEMQWGSDIIFSHGTSASKGIVVFLKKDLRKQIYNIYTDTEGRLIIFDIKQNNMMITIVALYAPNKDCPEFFQQIRKNIKDRYEHKIIIGDFNTVLDVEKDRLNTYNNNNKSKIEIENIMEEFCLNEIWRMQNEDKSEYSWRKKGNLNVASRIDYALVSAGLDQQVEHCTYITNIKSDHRALYMFVETNPFERGVGFWKFNTQLLKDKSFLEKMNIEIDTTLELLKDKDPIVKWEKIKERIKKVSQKYTRTKTGEDQLIISQLMEKIQDYEENLPLTQEDDQILQNTKDELDEKIEEKTKGMIFRSKVKWYEEGEKNTRYFYSLEKARYNAKTCYKLISNNEEVIENPKEILEIQKAYYEELYSKDEQVEFTLENKHGIQVLKQIQIQQEQQITIQEIKSAILRMNNNKTPGSDGIPIDFYKVF